ncbi:MAG: glycosyltransferase [Hyphomonadaceae bacterium]|nr:glycosyltransferase [Hyphomonadaceae bacterium]
MASVCALVLTYNRPELADVCLTALMGQTRPCDRIIVLDNASTEEALSALRARWADRVAIHSLPRNVGAAGGYAAGMHLAYLTGADFVFTLDDDVELAPDAVANLLEAEAFLAAEKIPAPFLVAVSHTTAPNVFDLPDIALDAPWPRFLDKGLLPLRRSPINAMLFPRSTIARYGLPLADMFIWGEDTEYTMRISRDAPGFLVGAAKQLHHRVVAGKLDIRTETNPARVRYHRYQKRNLIYVMRKNARRIALLRQVMREAGIVLQLCGRGRFDRAWIAARGVVEGFFFSPRPQAADAPFDFAGVRTFGPDARVSPAPHITSV